LELKGETSGISLDTSDPWAVDGSVATHTYVVSAIDGVGGESFLSAAARNDDRDHDGLTDQVEGELGTNPALVDTDGDGYSDSREVAAGSDPRDPASRLGTRRPQRHLRGAPTP
jgi:hypothetical protein